MSNKPLDVDQTRSTTKRLKEDLLSHDDCVRGNAIDEVFAQIVGLREVLKQTRDALSDAKEHLDFIGWGDSYERSCARDDRLPTKIDEALSAAEELVK